MNPEAIIEPSFEEINTAIDTLTLNREDLIDRLRVRRALLDFMRYRMSMAQNELWKSYREPAPKQTT